MTSRLTLDTFAAPLRRELEDRSTEVCVPTHHQRRLHPTLGAQMGDDLGGLVDGFTKDVAWCIGLARFSSSLRPEIVGLSRVVLVP
jgi:hypothetical protein